MSKEKQLMSAIIADQPGDPEVMHLGEAPVPTPQNGKVLIEVKAAGVNRLDCLQRMGKYPVPPGASEILGLEIAGIRTDTGEPVCALLTGGGYAEFALADEALCLPIPDGFSFEEAAAIPETFFTVWNNIFNLGQHREGCHVLVHGGSSGIGTTAIQMVKAMGGHMIVTAGSDEKCQACLALGADHAINYKEEDFAEAVLKLTHGKGVDIVLDMVGGDYVMRNIQCMAPYGRHVNIAFLRGAKAEIKLPDIMQKRVQLTGSFLRSRPVEEKAAIAENLRTHIFPHLDSGAIRPKIYEIFDLKDAAKAHRLIESSAHIGKIVLRTA